MQYISNKNTKTKTVSLPASHLVKGELLLELHWVVERVENHVSHTSGRADVHVVGEVVPVKDMSACMAQDPY
jgi:hypothetical protein